MIDLALQHIAILGAGSVVLFGPGLALLTLLGAHRAIAPSLLPAAALTVGLLPSGALTAIALSTGTPILVTTTILLLSTVLVGIAAIVRHRRTLSLPSLDTGRQVTLSIGITSAALAYVMGSRFKFDMLYHASVVQKLLAFDHPTWIVTSRYADGGPNPVYVVPVWHELIAQIAWLAHAGPIRALWLLPALLVPTAFFACAGVARTLLASPASGPVAGCAYLLVQVLMTGRPFEGIAYVVYPGNSMLAIVVPLAVAAWVTSIDGRDAPTRHRNLGLVCAACASLVLVHANYVFFLGLVVAGSVLAWSAEGTWDGSVFRRLLLSAGVVGSVAAIGLGLLMPTLAALQHFARGTGDGAFTTVFRFYGGQVVGTRDAFHLRPEELVDRYGALAVLGALAIPVFSLWRRTFASIVLLGTTLLVLAISQSDMLFRWLLALGSTTAGLRLGRMLELPIELAITLTVLICASVVERARAGGDRRTKLRAMTVVVTVFTIPLLVVSAWPVGSRLPGWPVPIVVVLVAAALLLPMVRWVGEQMDRAGPSFPRPDAAPTLIVLAALVLGCAPQIATRASIVRRALHHKLRTPYELDELRPIDTPVRSALHGLPVGAVVLSRPEVAPRIAATTPIFVVADDKVYLADTKRNSNRERLRTVEQFFDGTTSDVTRARILRSAHVDAVVLDRHDARSLMLTKLCARLRTAGERVAARECPQMLEDSQGARYVVLVRARQ